MDKVPTNSAMSAPHHPERRVPPPMNDIAETIKDLIAGSGKTVREVADGAGVSRQILWNFCNGRTIMLDVRTASKVKAFLTGEGLK